MVQEKLKWRSNGKCANEFFFVNPVVATSHTNKWNLMDHRNYQQGVFWRSHVFCALQQLTSSRRWLRLEMQQVATECSSSIMNVRLCIKNIHSLDWNYTSIHWKIPMWLQHFSRLWIGLRRMEWAVFLSLARKAQSWFLISVFSSLWYYITKWDHSR